MKKKTSDLDAAYPKPPKMIYCMPSKIVVSKHNFSRWRLAAMLDNSLNIRPNEKLTSDLDLAYQKNTKMTYYMPSKIAISKVIFSRWRLAAILDLCKL